MEQKILNTISIQKWVFLNSISNQIPSRSHHIWAIEIHISHAACYGMAISKIKYSSLFCPLTISQEEDGMDAREKYLLGVQKI